MGDRARTHITIGGTLPRSALGELARCADQYDLRVEWDGEPFDPAALVPGEPLELYGTELNGGQVSQLDEFCFEHGLTFRRWSGGCLGAFLPEIVLYGGTGRARDYTASEDERVLYSPAEIRSFTRMRDLKRDIAQAELAIPPLVLV